MISPENGGRPVPKHRANHKITRQAITTSDRSRPVRHDSWWLGPVATWRQLDQAGLDTYTLPIGSIVDVEHEPEWYDIAALIDRVNVLERRTRRLTDDVAHQFEQVGR